MKPFISPWNICIGSVYCSDAVYYCKPKLFFTAAIAINDLFCNLLLLFLKKKRKSFLFLQLLCMTGNDTFQQKSITQNIKIQLSQNVIFWSNKKFLKAYDLVLLFLEEKKVFCFGHGPWIPHFCQKIVIFRGSGNFFSELLDFY